MDWKTIERIAESPDKKWFFAQCEVAVLLGCDRRIAAAFLSEKSVPYRRIGKTKTYFLPEILEAVDKTKWADKRE